MNLIKARIRRCVVVCGFLYACEPAPGAQVDTQEDVADASEEVDLAPPPPRGTVRVEVGPAGMKTPVEITYVVVMTDSSGNEVERTEGLKSSSEDGSLTTELACSPTQEGQQLDVHLLIEEVEVTRPLIEGQDFYNPCVGLNDCTRRLPCIDGETSTAPFDFFITRREDGGAFDLGLAFGGMTCTFGVSCKEALLFVNGQRVRSHVVSLSCLGPAETPLNLWMDDLEVDCQSGKITLDSASPRGNQTAIGPIDMWANYRGEENSGANTKHYWSLALALGPTERCTLRTKGTSSTTFFAEGRTPPFFRYPHIGIETMIQGDSCEDSLSLIAAPLLFEYSPFGETGVCFGNQATQSGNSVEPEVIDTRCVP
jgi:hypothetical protein